ncbi:hypothetical protein M3223_19515 [Paenibacillus pasadenensis]|uniref:hypothetical protein n=1 Tax=Paenibacillus pasadenensis TaxID=217090 RepID=UPI00203D145D|nr:hypothetical protein [Paenibacillus pasadenensis]MCM3749545.1 hypothetical protein [Paenibacillus pasadenensis]
MSTWLDARAAQNASYGSSILVTIPTSGTLQQIGVLGLNLSSGTLGSTRVEFSGTVTFQQPTTPADAMVTVYVFRGATSSGVLVYSLSESILASETGPRVVSFNGCDFSAQVSSSAVYSVYVTASITGMTRVGPESVIFTGYSN